MYVFMAEHSVLENQFVCSSLGKTPVPLSTKLSCPQIFVRPPGLFLIRFYVFISIIFLQLRHGQPWFLRLYEHASDVTREHSFIGNSLSLWLFQSFWPFVYNVPLDVGVFCRYGLWKWAPQLCFLIVVVFL